MQTIELPSIEHVNALTTMLGVDVEASELQSGAWSVKLNDQADLTYQALPPDWITQGIQRNTDAASKTTGEEQARAALAAAGLNADQAVLLFFDALAENNLTISQFVARVAQISA